MWHSVIRLFPLVVVVVLRVCGPVRFALMQLVFWRILFPTRYR